MSLGLWSLAFNTKTEEQNVPGLGPIEPNTSVKLTYKCLSQHIGLRDLCQIPVFNIHAIWKSSYSNESAKPQCRLDAQWKIFEGGRLLALQFWINQQYPTVAILFFIHFLRLKCRYLVSGKRKHWKSHQKMQTKRAIFSSIDPNNAITWSSCNYERCTRFKIQQNLD